jgi:dihydropteroate synthase
LGQNTLNINGGLVQLEKPIVMSILNITDDSFYEASRLIAPQHALDIAALQMEQGATILDIGGYSSRPGAKDISVGEELDRILPVIELLSKSLPKAVLSVDTFRSVIAKKALESGAHIINDISAGEDPNMMETIAQFSCPYVIMHKKGTPQTMHINPTYNNVTLEVLNYLVNKTEQCKQLGIKDIIWDVGIGFGKTITHNFDLLDKLETFSNLSYPLLMGVSRKSLIWRTLNITPNESLNGTTALNMVCLMKGAKILRVHDVKEAMECITLYEKLNQFKG